LDEAEIVVIGRMNGYHLSIDNITVPTDGELASLQDPPLKNRELWQLPFLVWHTVYSVLVLKRKEKEKKGWHGLINYTATNNKINAKRS
jgi:hypothetical protein